MTYRINDNGAERDMTDDEIAVYEATAADTIARIKAQEQAIAAQEAAKTSARAKLKALGLTDDEIAALIP